MFKNCKVVVKVVINFDVEECDVFIWEMQVFFCLNSFGIVIFFYYFMQGGRFFLVMEYMFGGSLDECIYEVDGLLEEQVFGWVDKLCQILVFVYDYGIVHYDIKFVNILFILYDDI